MYLLKATMHVISDTIHNTFILYLLSKIVLGMEVENVLQMIFLLPIIQYLLLGRHHAKYIS